MVKLLLKIILFFWFALVIIGAFLYAPQAEGLGELTRVIYFHVPVAWVTVLAFFTGAVLSVVYLVKRQAVYDLYAEAANQLGFLFAILATITGSVWAKLSWGSFWNWDPRESSIFILLLIYAAYFALRSAIEQEDRKAALSSVYNILAFVTVPFFVFVVPRVYFSLHPDLLNNAQVKINMGPKIRLVFFSSLAGFTVIFYWLLKMKFELVKIVQSLKKMENK